MKKDLLTKMITIGALGLGGIVVTIILLWALSEGQNSKKADKPSGDHSIPTQESPVDIEGTGESLNGVKGIALVQMESNNKEVLPVYDVESRKQILLNIKGYTELKSAYGEQISLAQLRAGQIVEMKYDPQSFDAYQIQISGKAWEKRNPSGLMISAEQNKIKIGTDEYRFDSDYLSVTKGGVSVALSTISNFDEVVLRGYKDEVWAVEVLAGHGYIVLKNSDAFVGGTIEVGNRNIRTVEKDMRFEVTTGVKRVIITKDNMNPYSNDVFVEEGKEVVIDLAEFKPKTAKVMFNTVQDGVSLFINDQKQALSNGEITLDFGQYKIRAEKEGYVSWESMLTVNQVEMQVKIDMKVEPQYLEVQTPIGAELYVDGARIGVIPARTAITPGEHILTIRKDGYYSKNQTIQVNSNGKNVNYAFPDLIRIGSTDTEGNNNGVNSAQPVNPAPSTPSTNPNIKLNPTEDNY